MLEYLRANRDEFLQLASRVIRKNPTETLQGHMVVYYFFISHVHTRACTYHIYLIILQKSD